MRRALRWLVSAAALMLAPKCLLCAAAYLGLGAALGLTGPELCGAAPPAATPWMPPALALSAGATGVFAWHVRRRRACAMLSFRSFAVRQETSDAGRAERQ